MNSIFFPADGDYITEKYYECDFKMTWVGCISIKIYLYSRPLLSACLTPYSGSGNYLF